MSKWKTRKPTEGSRLVTRDQLQSAAQQIANAISVAINQVQVENEARLAVIEEKLGLSKATPEITDERTLTLVDDEPEGGAASINPESVS